MGQNQEKPSYVVAGFISPGFVEPEFTITLGMNAVVEHRLKGFTSGSSARINRARTSMIEDFMKMPDQMEYLWLVDTDMVFPIDALQKLLVKADEGRRLVGGLGYIFQTETGTIMPSIVHDASQTPGKYAKIYNEPPADEPRYIEAMATGAFCMLVHRSILQEMRDAHPELTYPWFDDIERGDGRIIGPDFEFYARAKEVTGETPIIDTHVRCGHIKKWNLTHEEAKNAWSQRNPE